MKCVLNCISWNTLKKIFHSVSSPWWKEVGSQVYAASHGPRLGIDFEKEKKS